jgi:hypothetical protein
LDDGVLLCGHNSRHTAGANSYLLPRPSGTAMMIDTPRWSRELAQRYAAPDADQVIRGLEPPRISEGVTAHPLPGHTRGSVLYLADDRYCFSGDRHRLAADEMSRRLRALAERTGLLRSRPIDFTAVRW